MPRLDRLFLIVSLLVSSSAHAWIPPSYFIVRKLAQKHEALTDARIQGKVTVYKSSGDIQHTFNETIVVPNHDYVSVRLSDESGKLVVAHTRRMSTAQSSRNGELQRPIPYDLLFVRDGANIFDHFKALGLPLKTEQELYSEKEGNMPYKPEQAAAYNRYENRVAVTIGEKGLKENYSNRTPQLWVEKDSYLPLKALFPSAPERGSSDPLEFRFTNFQPRRNFMYPQVMQVFRGGTLWVKVETTEVKPTAGKIDEPKTGSDLDGDVKDFLEMYFKWVR